MTRFTLSMAGRFGRAAGCRAALALGVLLLISSSIQAQTVESTGSRALGMGGAFVAVANDSSAVWWNPGGLADGPFFDSSVAWTTTEVDQGAPLGRNGVSGFFVGTPPAGFSYYQLRIMEIPTAAGQPGREDEQGGIPLRSLSATQLGVTLVHSLISGVHAGATLKYVRGSVGAGFGSVTSSGADLLDDAGDLDRGDTEHGFDMDLGVLAVAGPMRFGAVVRNVFELEFDGDDLSLPPMKLPRQVRLGAALDASTLGLPLMVALDVDAQRYDSPWGDRRVVAVGAEHWVVKRRLALRGGARFNTVGREEKTGTAGVSVGVRAGLYVDGHVVRGGDAGERGWGVAARVSF
jgi:hypothetical protein